MILNVEERLEDLTYGNSGSTVQRITRLHLLFDCSFDAGLQLFVSLFALHDSRSKLLRLDLGLGIPDIQVP